MLSTITRYGAVASTSVVQEDAPPRDAPPSPMVDVIDLSVEARALMDNNGTQPQKDEGVPTYRHLARISYKVAPPPDFSEESG